MGKGKKKKNKRTKKGAIDSDFIPFDLDKSPV